MAERKSRKVELICLCCKKSCLRKPSRVGKYCSKPCHFKHRTTPLEIRFWRMVNKTNSCWLWTGTTYRNGGHGMFEGTTAHRMAWILLNGPIQNSLYVCHNCPGGDNPICVRPDHMFLGTQSDNMKDSVAKGTTPRGERIQSAKLTAEEVIKIRERYATGNESLKAIGKENGICKGSVHDIVTRRTWSHV